MRLQRLKQLKTEASPSLYLKCGALLLLFLLSVLIVACGSDTPTNTNLGNPLVTVTINLNQNNSSPTPLLPAYTCGAWVTNTTPGLNTSSIVNVYAKFIHNVDNNPVGVGSAKAQATVMWPDGSTNTLTATTTPDGLAVFPVSVKSAAFAINKVVLVTISFSSPDSHTCQVGADQAAYFTLVVVSPTTTSTKVPSPTATSTGTPSTTPTATGTPTRPRKTPTPHG
jgi:hypothetical protein